MATDAGRANWTNVTVARTLPYSYPAMMNLPGPHRSAELSNCRLVRLRFCARKRDKLPRSGVSTTSLQNILVLESCLGPL